MNIVESTHIIAKILESGGVRHIVVSSGSRSLRMVRAVADNLSFDTRMIVDERVAAFFALGMSICTSRPVALVCTSGSAMLNYAPAIAEAYYRGIPLIVITADRPRDMIGINDGQTINQRNAFGNIVKKSIDIDATVPCDSAAFDEVAQAVGTALSPRKGPVHINLHLEEGDDCLDYGAIDYVPQMFRGSWPVASIPEIPAADVCGKRILIFIGQREYDAEFDTLINRLTRYGNIAIVADIISNCTVEGVMTDTESIAGELTRHPVAYSPELLITLGKTSPLSRRFKEWLRNLQDYRHWRVNDTPQPEDTYFHLDRTIVADDNTFLKHLTEILDACADHNYTSIDTDIEEAHSHRYRECWLSAYRDAVAVKDQLLARAPWSDICAINTIVRMLPAGYNLQCSNGMSIRYLSMTGSGRHNVQSNRGVNGIDGSTSTALGYSAVASNPTLLITGDMSALYDVAALFCGQLTPRFKMIIIDNGGGEIFRAIKATRDYEKREEMLSAIPRLRWDYIARAVDIAYFEADDKAALEEVLPDFYNISDKAAMLLVKTPAGNSHVYRKIINEIHHITKHKNE